MKKTTLGTTIASLRREIGMTQLELAEKMGVTDKAVSKWERDLSCPDISSIPRLAEIFGISVDELMQVRVRKDDDAADKKAQLTSLISLILKTVALAMGVVTVALSAMKKLDTDSGLTMLGIGLACLAINALSADKGENS